MKQLAFILNPAAARGRAARREAVLKAAMAEAGLTGRVVRTEAPGHAAALAHEAAQTADAVVAVGGDGTVHEVGCGLVRSARRIPLGVIPVGTGNDFVRMIGMPRDVRAAVRALASAAERPVDFGVVRWEDDAGWQEHAFFNAVGVGFDAQVAHETAAFKRLPGKAVYVAAVLQAVRHWQPPEAHIQVQVEGENGESWQPLYEGPLLFVTAGNGTCSGGGFLLTPDASLTDGLLDVCAVAAASVGRVVRLVPRAMRGRHLSEPEVHLRQAPAARIEADRPVPIHADGEVVCRGARSVEIRVVARGLTVLAPDNVL